MHLVTAGKRLSGPSPQIIRWYNVLIIEAAAIGWLELSVRASRLPSHRSCSAVLRVTYRMATLHGSICTCGVTTDHVHDAVSVLEACDMAQALGWSALPLPVWEVRGIAPSCKDGTCPTSCLAAMCIHADHGVCQDSVL